MATKQTRKKKATAYAELGPEEERVRLIVLAWWKESGMTQVQVGDRLKWGQSRVSSILVGRSAIGLDALPALAECFGHKAVDVFERNPNKASDPETEKVMKRFRPLPDVVQASVLKTMDSFLEVLGRRK